jgi:hypothetical protein
MEAGPLSSVKLGHAHAIASLISADVIFLPGGGGWDV